MLYTSEYFASSRKHTNRRRVYCAVYESNNEAVKSEIGSFFEAFRTG